MKDDEGETVLYQRLQACVPGGDGVVVHLSSYYHHRYNGKGKRLCNISTHVSFPFMWNFNLLVLLYKNR